MTPAALLPHAGAMVLIDRVVAWTDHEAVCATRAHLAPGNPLRRGGMLPAICGMEIALLAAAAGKVAVIPPKKNRKSPRTYDKALYRARHLIENFFCWLKQFRGIATRYDKTSRNFLAAIHMVAALCWLN